MCHSNRIITRRTLVARSRAAEAQLHRPDQQSSLLSMTLRLPNRRTLRHNVIHSPEIRRLVGVARQQVVVRMWRRTEEAAESSFGRVERRSVVCRTTTLPLRLGRSCATDVLHQYQRTSFSSPRADFSFLPHSSFFFCPSFQTHALETVFNLPHTMTHSRGSRIHIVGLLFRVQTLAE